MAGVVDGAIMLSAYQRRQPQTPAFGEYRIGAGGGRRRDDPASSVRHRVSMLAKNRSRRRDSRSCRAADCNKKIHESTTRDAV
jgi:hypothetical protein